MKKLVPLSISETMRSATSPRMKRSVPYSFGAGFTGGLVGRVSGFFMVPAVDTYIEMPFSVLALHALPCVNTSARSDDFAPAVRQERALAGSVGLYLDGKPRLNQLLSLSVERPA